MATPTMEILRDIDGQLAALRLELRLHRQDYKTHRLVTEARLKTLENRLDRWVETIRKLLTSSLSKFVMCAGMFWIGKPVADILLIFLKH